MEVYSSFSIENSALSENDQANRRTAANVKPFSGNGWQELQSKPPTTRRTSYFSQPCSHAMPFFHTI